MSRVSRILLKFGIFFFFLAGFVVIAQKAEAAPGYGYVWPHSVDVFNVCPSGQGQYTMHMHDEGGAALGGGGSISVSVPGQGTWNGGNSTTTGCVPTSSGFQLTASYPGYQTQRVNFQLMASVRSASNTHRYHINVFMTNTITTNVTPTGGDFSSSPTFTVYTRQGPPASAAIPSTPGCVYQMWAEITGSVNETRLIATNAGFGNFNYNPGLPNGNYTMWFHFTYCSPYPVAAYTGPVSFTIAPPPPPPPPPSSGTIRGRVWLDDDRDGNWDNNEWEPLIRNSSSSCTSTSTPLFTQSGINVDRFGASSGTSSLNNCNPDPYYKFDNITPGSYTVNVNTPSGWSKTGQDYLPTGWSYSNGSASGNLPDGASYNLWFGIMKEKPPPCPSSTTPGLGDVSRPGGGSPDGKITYADALYIQKAVLGMVPLPPLNRGDVNQDGAITITDAFVLFQWLFNDVNNITCPEPTPSPPPPPPGPPPPSPTFYPDYIIRNSTGGTSPPIYGDTTVTCGVQERYDAETWNVGAVNATSSSVTTATTTGSTNNNDEFVVAPLSHFSGSNYSSNHFFYTSWSSAGTYTVTFTADAYGNITESNEGNNSVSITVNVTCPVPPPAPTCIVNHTPSSPVNAGTNVTLNWVTTNAVSGTITSPLGTWSITSSQLPNGTRTVNSINSTTTFNFVFSNSAGETVNCQTTVTVNAAPAPDFNFGCSPRIAGVCTVTVNQGTPAVYDLILTPNATWVDNDVGLTHPSMTFNTTFCGGLTGHPTNPVLIALFSGTPTTCDLRVETDTITPGSYPFTIRARSQLPDGTILTKDLPSVLIVNVAPNLPWLKTEKGDVGSRGPINMPSAGFEHASFAIFSQSGITNFDSQKKWSLPNYTPLDLPSTGYSNVFNNLVSKFKPTALTVSNDLSNVTGGGVFIHNAAPALAISGGVNYTGQPAVIFVNNNLELNGDLTVADNTGLIFVARGQIDIKSAVQNLHGIYIATDNDVTTKSGVACPPSYVGTQSPLIVRGSIYGFTRLCFDRTLDSASNAIQPAEHIIFEPKYLWLFKEIFGDRTQQFSEVSP